MNLDISIEEDNANRYSAVSKSDSISVMSESQGVIVENPDGTYLHGIPSKLRKGQYNSSGEGKEAINNGLENYPRNRILYIVDDDEIAVYSGFNQLPVIVDEFLELYLRHAKYFVFGLFVMMFCEATLWGLGYRDRINAVNELMDEYKTNAVQELTTLYMTFLWSELGYIVIYYILGYLSVYKRSVRLYSWFANYTLMGLILEMALAYVNRFDIFIFIMRFIAFIYSRFLNQLLVSLLLLPR